MSVLNILSNNTSLTREEDAVTVDCIPLALSWNPEGILGSLFAVSLNIQAHPVE